MSAKLVVGVAGLAVVTMLAAGCAESRPPAAPIVAPLHAAPAPAPGSIAGTLATARARAPEAREVAEVRCERDRFRDREACSVSIRLSAGAGGVNASGRLISRDAGRSWDIVLSARPMAYRLRVDQNPTIAGACGGALNECRLTGAQAAALTQQLRRGQTLAAQVTGYRALLDADVPLAGVGEALDEARRRAP